MLGEIQNDYCNNLETLAEQQECLRDFDLNNNAELDAEKELSSKSNNITIDSSYWYFLI